MARDRCDLDTSVPDWVIEYPAALAVFEGLGIDCCCGGKSLRYACLERGLDAEVVLARLRRSSPDSRESEQDGGSRESMS